MTRGKYTLNKDTYNRTERYCPWDRADRRAKIHTKKRNTNRKETVSVDTLDSTISETDIQDGEGFAYSPKIFTNPKFPLTEGDEIEVVNKKIIGEHCEECLKKFDRCWCDRSDCDEELMEVEPPEALLIVQIVN